MGRDFENRKTAILARSSRISKLFTRLGRDIEIAVKAGGSDPDANPSLRRVLQNARSANMPKDRIKAAIERAEGKDSSDWEVLHYEGYGPHGIAVMVEAATDNPTRTIANIRVAFNKGGGNLGTSGSVGFLFNHMGVFILDPEGIDRDELELELIDHGLEELLEDTDEDDNPILIIRTAFTDFGTMQTALEERGIEPKSSKLEYIPLNTIKLTDDQIDEVLGLVARLEQDDDVQNVFHTLA